jgi:MFS family permease
MPVAQTRKRIGLIMILAVLWQGIWFVALGLIHSLPLAMVALCAFSMGVPMVIAMALGLIQVLSPPEMRARLVSLFTMVTFGAQPISAIIVGWSAEIFGVGRVILVNGALFVLGGLALLLLRRGLKEWVPAPLV